MCLNFSIYRHDYLCLRLLFYETFSGALLIILMIFPLSETTNVILVSGDCQLFSLSV